MPYIRVWIHMVWSTKNRQPLIHNELRPKLFAHMKENVLKKNIKLDSINGVEDHVHALVRIKADETIANIARLLKGESSHWVNARKLTHEKFQWQEEYYAVSVSESKVERVRKYIANQEQHHRKKMFAREDEELIVK